MIKFINFIVWKWDFMVNKFEKLTFLQKLQLYLLVPMVLWLLFIVYENYIYHYDSTMANKKTMKSRNLPQLEHTNKITKYDLKKSMLFLENKIDIYNLSLHSMQVKKTNIILELFGKFDGLVAILQKIHSHFQIRSFQFLKNDTKQTFIVTIDTKYFFNEELKDKEFIIQNIQKKLIKIEAIVDQEVLIGGNWFSKNDFYQNFKIINIGKDFIDVIDQKTKKQFHMELVDESI